MLNPNTNSYAKRWLQYEKPFSANHYNGVNPANLILASRLGNCVTLVAPHAVNTVWRGAGKLADRRTGGLVRLLADLTGCGYIARSATDTQPDSWENRSDVFAKTLYEACTQSNIILDIHGMGNNYGADMWLGVGNTPTEHQDRLVDLFLSVFSSATVAVGKPFSAASAHTVVSAVSGLPTAALQVELAASWRDPTDSADKATRLVMQLESYIKALQHECDNGMFA